MFESYAELGECSTLYMMIVYQLRFESYAELGECSTYLLIYFNSICLRVMLN